MTDIIIGSAASGEPGDASYTVDFKFSGSLSFRTEEVWEFGLYEEGREVDVEELLTKVLERRMRECALPYCVYSRRTEKQIRSRIEEQFCEKKGYGGAWAECVEAAADNVLEFLKSEGYAGDEAYCDSYFRSRFDKDVSSNQIVYELVRRGIPAELAEAAASRSSRDDEESCRRALEKKLRVRFGDGKRRSVSDVKEKAALVRFLISRGFDTGLAARTVEKYAASPDED
jgi:SOS response regulatory protein OraA/RecX